MTKTNEHPSVCTYTTSVEAVRFTGKNAQEIVDWANSKAQDSAIIREGGRLFVISGHAPQNCVFGVAVDEYVVFSELDGFRGIGQGEFAKNYRIQ
jgi:hypothetical protein